MHSPWHSRWWTHRADVLPAIVPARQGPTSVEFGKADGVGKNYEGCAQHAALPRSARRCRSAPVDALAYAAGVVDVASPRLGNA